MRGQIAVLRIWDSKTDGVDSCPPAGTAHLVANYLFDAVGKTMRDRRWV